MLTDDERSALMGFLASGMEEFGADGFEEVDFTSGGKLVCVSESSGEVVFGSIDRLLELIKEAFHQGSISAGRGVVF